MTRHKIIEAINHRLEQLETRRLKQLLETFETTRLEILPGKGRKIGRHKPVPVKSNMGSEQIIREARDSRIEHLAVLYELW
jgi:hypothetical protein